MTPSIRMRVGRTPIQARPPIQARADIVLRRGKHHIVVQVTVTTPAEYEADSVRKFLKASFTHIAVISVNRQKLNLIRKALGASGEKPETVGFYSPEEFMLKLSDWAMDDPAGGIAEKKNPHKKPNPFRQICSFGMANIISERSI